LIWNGPTPSFFLHGPFFWGLCDARFFLGFHPFRLFSPDCGFDVDLKSQKFTAQFPLHEQGMALGVPEIKTLSPLLPKIFPSPSTGRLFLFHAAFPGLLSFFFRPWITSISCARDCGWSFRHGYDLLAKAFPPLLLTQESFLGSAPTHFFRSFGDVLVFIGAFPSSLKRVEPDFPFFS